MRRILCLLLTTAVVACGSAETSSLKQMTGAAAEPLDSGETPDTVDQSNLEPLTLNDPGVAGPFKVLSFTPAIKNSGYKSAIIYYPSQAASEVLPAMTLTGGFTNTKEQMSWLGTHLASHGIIVIAFTPTNSFSTNAQTWADGHKGGISTLQGENSRAASPIANRVDAQRLGVIGYSYGGAGSILAANQLPGIVNAAIPICAYQPAAPTSKIPYMFVTGTADTVASPTSILNTYTRLNASPAKAFVNLNKVSHLDIINGGERHASIARFVTSWALVFMADKKDYKTYLNGELLQKQLADKTVFATAGDYKYSE